MIQHAGRVHIIENVCDNDGHGKKVLVALSGGVDSAAAACILLERGFEVTGAFLCMERPAEDCSARTCCSPQDAWDAAAVADKLGIRLLKIPAAGYFEKIMSDFADEYATGRTPNPCIHCNVLLKFGHLAKIADDAGIDYIATGHYARVVQTADGNCFARSFAKNKDQSYVLFALSPDLLGRILLPLGNFTNKLEIRQIALAAGLPVHDKPESQDICFIAENGLANFMRRMRPDSMRAGNIYDTAEKIVGHHDGAAQYTIGQRRGIGVSAAEALYVTRVDPENASIWVGPRETLNMGGLFANNSNWFCDLPQKFEAKVQLRAHHATVPAYIRILPENRFEVKFTSPIIGVTPGQAAVVYRDDILLGGGWIE
ncbi:MAG TPA: tRNA 2-thiouridine(34) synthase MnmA [Phycisphaerae bacterium]|nr:tRNA 2-thiouridine(34) synthase MnmA [Phycisphaerae bacterium]